MEGANGSVDVMQVLGPGNYAVYRLAATNGRLKFGPSEEGKYIPSSGYGLFKSLFQMEVIAMVPLPLT